MNGGYVYGGVEHENDEMVDNLSSKVKALKSVSIFEQWYCVTFKFDLTYHFLKLKINLWLGGIEEIELNYKI